MKKIRNIMIVIAMACIVLLTGTLFNLKSGETLTLPNTGVTKIYKQPIYVHHDAVTHTVHHDAVTHEEPVYETVYHEAVTEQVWVVDTPAYDETYYVCNGCGATK